MPVQMGLRPWSNRLTMTGYHGALRCGSRRRRRKLPEAAEFDFLSLAERTGNAAEHGVDDQDVPSKRVAYFAPGKELKELINRVGGAGPTGCGSGADVQWRAVEEARGSANDAAAGTDPFPYRRGTTSRERRGPAGV